MTPDRWITALESGALLLPDTGRVLVMRARGDARLEAFGPERVLAVQSFFPDHARLTARGFETLAEMDASNAPDIAAALIQIVKSKADTLNALAEAVVLTRPGGLILVDGQKGEGIESILKEIKKLLPVEEVLSKAHGKLFWFERPETLPEQIINWIAEPAEIEGGYIVPPGGFSADHADPGSELLVALVPALKGRVADLGAGWGFIAANLLDEQESIQSLDLIEADWRALEAARVNIEDERAAFFWDDARSFKPSELYDSVVCNPPFHTGREADPALGRAFITAASRLLKPSGQFFMVANRHLPYEAALKDHFGTGKMLAEIQGYKLYQAGKPVRARR